MRCVAESCGRDPGGTTRGSVLCLHRLRLYSDPEQLKAAFYEFKVVADQKKVVTDADLEALMDFSSQQSEESWVLSSVYVTSGAYVRAT